MIAKSISDKNLSQIKPGQKTRVLKITGGGPIKRRIMEMGLVPGAEIEMERYAPLGDPIEVKLTGQHLSLRIEEAERVVVE